MTPPTPARSPGLSRRAVLGLGATVPLALLGGCSTTGARERWDSSVDRLEAPRSTPPAPTNPDQPSVDAAVAAIADLRAALLPHRGAAPVIADLVRLHAAHLARLGAPASAGTPATLGSAPVLTEAVVRERTLVTLLATRAAQVQDGELARLLAAMSAAIVQRLAQDGA